MNIVLKKKVFLLPKVTYEYKEGETNICSNKNESMKEGKHFNFPTGNKENNVKKYDLEKSKNIFNQCNNTRENKFQKYTIHSIRNLSKASRFSITTIPRYFSFYSRKNR